MLDFGYTLDNELTVPVGRIPTGIQTQALEMAINRIGRRYRSAKKLLVQKVPGFDQRTVQTVSKDWKLRLITEVRFLDALPGLINVRAAKLVNTYNRNAVTQTMGRQAWNQWAALVIKEYRSAVAAFGNEVSKAISNTPVNGLPAAFMRVAQVAGVPAPVLLDAKAAGLESLPEVDDPDYLAGLDGAGTLMAGIAGAGLLFVGLFWLAARSEEKGAMGSLEDELAPMHYPWAVPYQATSVQPRKTVLRCRQYRTVGGRRRCIRRGRYPVVKGPRALRPPPWRQDCPGCLPRRMRVRGV
jgi:hypothetical protein